MSLFPATVVPGACRSHPNSAICTKPLSVAKTRSVARSELMQRRDDESGYARGFAMGVAPGLAGPQRRTETVQRRQPPIHPRKNRFPQSETFGLVRIRLCPHGLAGNWLGYPMPLCAMHSDDADRPGAAWKSQPHFLLAFVRLPAGLACPFPGSRGCSSRNRGAAGGDGVRSVG